MTFTTSVTFNDIAALADIPAVSHVTSQRLADGRFAVAGSGSFGTILRIFDATGAVERSLFIAGTEAEMCRTQAGNLTVMTHDGTQMRVTQIDATNTVLGSEIIQLSSITSFSLVATTGNGFAMAASYDPTGSGSNGVINFFDGLQHAKNFVALDDWTDPVDDVQLTRLANGNLVTVWQSGAVLKFAIHAADGTELTPPALLQQTGTFNSAFPAIVSTGTGFLVAYTSLPNVTSSTLDVFVASYSGNGTYQSTVNASDGTFFDNGMSDARPEFARGPDGTIALTWTSSNPDTGERMQNLALMTSLDGQTTVGPITTFAGNGTVSFFGTGQIAAYLLDAATGSATGRHLTVITDSFGDGRSESFVGDDFDNLINGLGGNDTINAGNGQDEVLGGNGKDRLTGGGGHDALSGEDGQDVLAGGTGNDRLYGGTSNDRLTGEDGDDTLAGGAGVDAVTGGAGADWFVFDQTGSENREVIADFQSGTDRLALVASLFGTLGATVEKSELRFGTAALDQNDHLLYIGSTGALLYDADGSGTGDAVQIAALGAGTTLFASDFLIFA